MHSYLGAFVERESSTFYNDPPFADPDRTPQQHSNEVKHMNDARAELFSAKAAPAMEWLAETEFGVHYAAEWGGETDPAGTSWARNEDVQAAFLNCAEMTIWKLPNAVRFAQYPYQDAAEDNEFYTGLNRPDGSAKPARDAFRAPLTVDRRSDGALEVWGAWRPSPRPAHVTVVGFDSGWVERWRRDISLAESKYYHGIFWNVPGGLRYRAWPANQPGHSRIASGGDCYPHWLGGAATPGT